MKRQGVVGGMWKDAEHQTDQSCLRSSCPNNAQGHYSCWTKSSHVDLDLNRQAEAHEERYSKGVLTWHSSAMVPVKSLCHLCTPLKDWR